jgi:hypothetical protein
MAINFLDPVTRFGTIKDRQDIVPALMKYQVFEQMGQERVEELVNRAEQERDFYMDLNSLAIHILREYVK